VDPYTYTYVTNNLSGIYCHLVMIRNIVLDNLTLMVFYFLVKKATMKILMGYFRFRTFNLQHKCIMFNRSYQLSPN